MSLSLDEALSRQVAEQVKSKARQPFENAYKAALVTEGALYVQGFLIYASKPYRLVEHGWLEVGNRIVDPNLPHLNKKAEELSYFSAQRITVKKLKAAIEEAKEDYPEDDPLPIYGSSPYEYYGDVMLGGKEYLEAYKAAEAKLLELNQQMVEKN
ncbi:MAG: hypothetical protein HC827_23835 [Cyanobacteria bacterium RM1_2_2]|nr:hypothetical protein [Cyanobacteria bacterium RM1_2_2]